MLKVWQNSSFLIVGFLEMTDGAEKAALCLQAAGTASQMWTFVKGEAVYVLRDHLWLAQGEQHLFVGELAGSITP